MFLHEFLHLTYNLDELINYLCNKKVIRQQIKCPRCDTMLQFHSDNTNFIIKCTNSYYKIIRGRKRQRKVCNFTISALHDTWFSRSHLNLQKICRFIGYFIMFPPPRQTFLEQELNITAHTVVDWTNFCREVITICYIYTYIYICIYIYSFFLFMLEMFLTVFHMYLLVVISMA